MNQKASWTLLAAGAFMFLGLVAHDLQSHSTWASLATPETVGDLLGELATAGIAVLGALGVVLPKGEK